MIKIYVQNKPLILTETIDTEVEQYMHSPETILIDELNDAAVKTMLQQLEKDEFYSGVFLHPNQDEILQAFKRTLTLIQAAGGLVYTKQNEVLLIFRKGKWDLPKGKLDDGEELENCALREIEEETGATSIQIEQPLQITYHTYHHKGKNILKESHWYLIKTENRSALTPQTEEDIEIAEWVPLEKIENYLSNMHASIIDVVKKAGKVLKEKS